MSELNEQAKQALDEVKAGLKGEIVTELRESLSGAITSDVLANVEKQLKEVKQPVGDEKAQAEQALKSFKAQYHKDILGKVTKDLDTTTATSGAELVPEYFGSEVIRIAGQYGVARQNARVITLPGKTFTLPTMGSVTGYRTDEKGAITASSPATGNLTFTAKKVAGMVICTTEAIEDANIDILNWIAQLSGEAIAKVEDQWAFLGLTGTEGIFRNTSVPVYTLGSGDVTYASANLEDLRLSLDLADDAVVDQMKWLGSFSMLNHFRGLKDDYGQYVLQQPAGKLPTTIWDLPYIKSTVMPKRTAVSQADAPFMALYDPRYLMIGDRRKVTLEFSKEATVTSSDGQTTVNLFEQDMVAVRVTERIDIQLAEADKAFVRLETSAS